MAVCSDDGKILKVLLRDRETGISYRAYPCEGFYVKVVTDGSRHFIHPVYCKICPVCLQRGLWVPKARDDCSGRVDIAQKLVEIIDID